MTSVRNYGTIAKLRIAPAAHLGFAGVFTLAPRHRDTAARPASHHPNAITEADLGIADGSGELAGKFEEAMQTTLPEKVENVGLAVLTVIGLLLLLV